MKRELVFALGYQSQLTASSLTRAPVQSQTGLTHSNGGFDSDDVSQNKRLKVSTLKVYSRRVKLNNGNSEAPKSEEKTSPILEQEIVVASSPIEVQPNGTLRSSTPEEEVENDQNVLVEVVVQEDFNNICRKPAFREARRRRIYSDGELVDVVIQEDAECKSSSFICKEGRENFENSVGNGVYCDEGSGLNNGSLPELVQRQFTRPFFASEVQEDEEERAMENVVSEPENVARLSISSLDGDAARGVNELATPSKMDWKMSKKIAFNKKIMTVRDLFETGLLDGVTVVYMGGLTKVSGLRGTIQDGGILCSCSLCNGLRVLPPSQFEIHACKVYRRAAQYICLENGKSLLDVLKACRSAPAYMLEDTIQRIINTLPVEKTFNCRGCKNTFPAPTMPLTIRGGPLCSICIELKKSQSPSVPSSSKISRSAKAVATLEASPVMKISVHDSSEPRIKSQPIYTRLISNSKFPEIDSSYPKRNLSEKTTKSARSILPSKSCRSVPAYILKQKKSRLKKLKKSSKLGSKLKFAKIASASASSQKKKSQWKITIKDQRLHRLVFENDGLPDGTEVAYYSRGEKILEGYKKGFGIFCRCCNTEVSPSQFEAHAGWASRKKPYSNIYTSNGVSLHELAISLSRGRKYSAKDNDNLCTICADGGNLLLCDGCPRAFHRECASLTSIPRGDWYCHYCQNLLQKEKFVNENALAAGRVSGVDPIEEITKRCIRIVKNIAVEVSGCALCGGYDFSKAGFGPRTIILCDQCEQEFHIGCLRERKMANLKELPKGKWFCCGDCNQIYSTLQSLLMYGPEKLNNSVLSIIKKKHEEKGLDTSGDFDVSWRLLSGSFASPESRRLLSEAVSIFHECFDPIVDWMTGRDLIPAMVYGRSTRRQEYGGMYCAVLIINSVVISAGILRVFGKEIAELPLVATRKDSHDKGYFQLLFSCIEKLLTLMNVRSLVLPAAAEAESIWIDKFGFKPIDPEELMRFRKTGCQMLTFQGTSMLKKPVSELTVTKSES